MAQNEEHEEKDNAKKVQHTYPLVKYSDMNEDMRTEALEMSLTACEKYSSNYESAARVIKEYMDKKFGIYWHVVVGEAYGFKVSYETEHILNLYFGGNLAVVIWKCR